MNATQAYSSKEELRKKIFSILGSVCDPEVPVLSVLDLGIVRSVDVEQDMHEPVVNIAITPTYTGCPAIDVMRMNIRMALLEGGFSRINIKEILSPAWTTDWMTEHGKEKLKAYGIAPPHYKQQVCTPGLFQEEEAVPCPLCNSYHTTLISQFGSTACKSLYRCEDCREPFDYFKCH